MRSIATIKEIATATGLSRQRVSGRLNKLNCHFLWKTGKSGKEKHYFIAFLPEKYRIALAAKDATPVLGNPTDLAGQIGAEAARSILSARAEEKERLQIAKEQGLAAFERLPEQRKLEASARYYFLSMANNFVKAARFEIRRYALRSKVGDQAFVEAYNSGKVQVDADISAVIGSKTSYSTLKRIADNYQKYGIAGLAFNYHNPKRGSTALDDKQQDFVIGLMCDSPETTAKNLRRGLQGKFGADVPSVNVIGRFCKRWVQQNEDLWLYYTNPDAWKNKKMFAFGSASIHVERLNQLWEADSTPADVMLADGRHSIIGMIDVYSRRLRFLVSKTSRAASVVSLVRHCLIEWGVPEIIKTDNGKDYVSQHVIRVFAGLNIEQQLCTPFQGQEKPHIERAFKTFLHNIVEMMPNYIGHNVTDRKAIESRRSFAERIMNKDSDPVEMGMTSRELQKFCDEWVNFVYHHDRHDGLNGKKPIDMVRNWKEPIRRISELRALDMLLMPAPRDGGIRTITKKGVVVEGRHYQSGEFTGLVGEQVYVLLDPADLGTAYIYLEKDNGERTFLCPAIDPAWSGIDPAAFAVQARKHQDKVMREGRRELNKLAKQEGVQDAYANYVKFRKGQVENIVEMPTRAKNYTTNGLEEAGKAVTAIDAIRQEEATLETMNFALDLDDAPTIAPPTNKKAKVVLLLSDSDRYVQIRDRAKQEKTPLSEFDYDWLGDYYQSSTGKLYLKLEGDLRKKYGMVGKERAGL